MTTTARTLLTIEGYSVEGGLDVPYGPSTCFAPAIALGRLRGPGEAAGLWRAGVYESLLDAAATLGLGGVRLGVEWARVEPRRGHVDDDALARYVALASRARSNGLAVSITLVDAAWPSWLGLEAWQLPWVVPHVIEHARRIVAAVPDDEVALQPFADASSLVRGYLDAGVPPWRRGATREAAFASRQLALVMAELEADADVGPRLVRSSSSTSLAAGPAALRWARETSDVDEIHVRSLLAGHGPARSGFGLLAFEGDAFRVIREDLLRALR